MSAAWWRRRAGVADPRELLVRHAGALHDFVASLARLHALTGEETDELEAAINARLAENDFETLRDFRGSTNFTTFLYVVVERLVRQHRDERWDRWREQAAAKGLAEAAAALESMVYEDALSFEEALAVVATRSDPAPNPMELETLWAARPWRGTRQVADLKWQAPTTKPAPPGARELTVLERHLAEALQDLPARIDSSCKSTSPLVCPCRRSRRGSAGGRTRWRCTSIP